MTIESPSYYVYTPDSKLELRTMGWTDWLFAKAISTPAVRCAQRSLDALKQSMQRNDLNALNLSAKDFKVIKSHQETLKTPENSRLIKCKNIEDFRISMRVQALRKENKKDASVKLVAKYCKLTQVNDVLSQVILEMDPQEIVPFLKEHRTIVNKLVQNQNTKGLKAFIDRPILSSSIKEAKLSLERVLLFIDKFVEDGSSLESNFPIFSSKNLLLYFTASIGDWDLLQNLQNQGLDIFTKDNHGGTILHYAAMGGQKEFIERLVEEKGFDIHTKNNYGATILHYAAQEGHKEFVEWLVEEKGFDIHAKDNYGATILHYAALEGHKEFVEWLVEEKGFDIHAKDNEGKTVLHSSAKRGHKEFVEWLVEEKGFDIHAKDNYGATILHYAVLGGDKEFVLFLVKKRGFDIRARDNEGKTVLHYAAMGGRKELIEFFVSFEGGGLDIRAKTNIDLTILHYAVTNGEKKLVSWLVEEKGFDIHAKNKDGITILHYAAIGGQKEFIEWIVEEKGFDVHVKSNNAATILHYAAWGGQRELIKWLVKEKRLDIHAKNKKGQTILHYAAFGNQREFIKWLIERKSFNLRDLRQIRSSLAQSAYQELEELAFKKKYPWKLQCPRLQPSTKSMSLPPAIKEIPPLPKSWKAIKQETTKLLESKTQYSDDTKIVKGVKDLLDRIDTQRSGTAVPLAGKGNYYNRMKLYTGHLLLYAQEKESQDPTEAEGVYTLLAGTFKRCGGVLEDLEQTYFNKCRKEKVEDLDSAITALGFQFRMSFLSSYVDAYLSVDVHRSHCFRSLVASRAGTLEPQEEDRLAPYHAEELADLVETFLKELPLAYAIQFVQILHEQLKIGNGDPAALKIGEGDSFSEKLADQILILDCFSLSFMGRLEEKYQEMKQIAQEGAPKQKEKLAADLQYLIDIEDIPNLPTSILDAIGSHTELDLVEVKALRHYLFYPLVHQLVTKEEVCSYLEKAGWCEKAKKAAGISS